MPWPTDERTRTTTPTTCTSCSRPPGPIRSAGIGHYEVLEVLGQGGFGIVFRAFDDDAAARGRDQGAGPAAGRHLAGPQAVPARGPVLGRRFATRTSCRSTRSSEQPLPYLVMEFIPGETLQQRLDRTGPLEVPEVLRIGRQIAEGLAAAHAHGPDPPRHQAGQHPARRRAAQQVKITDFGLARAADDASMTAERRSSPARRCTWPRSRPTGETLDQRADLFSLGSVLYTMVTGRPPFRANSTLAVLKRVAEDTPRPIREIIPEMPEWLCDIIAKLHAKNPDDRFQSAREVADVLADCEAQLKANQAVKNVLPAAVKPARSEMGCRGGGPVASRDRAGRDGVRRGDASVPAGGDARPEQIRCRDDADRGREERNPGPDGEVERRCRPRSRTASAWSS